MTTFYLFQSSVFEKFPPGGSVCFFINPNTLRRAAALLLYSLICPIHAGLLPEPHRRGLAARWLGRRGCRQARRLRSLSAAHRQHRALAALTLGEWTAVCVAPAGCARARQPWPPASGPARRHEQSAPRLDTSACPWTIDSPRRSLYTQLCQTPVSDTLYKPVHCKRNSVANFFGPS